MRFLLFNIAVIGALAYLFMMERDGVEATAERLQENLQQVGSQVAEVLDAPAPSPVEVPLMEAQMAPTEAPPPPPPVRTVESGAPEWPSDPLVAELAPVSDPAVERRRQEILVGLDGPAPAPETVSPEVVLAEGESLMSPNERVKQLHNLAEEMELLFVQSLSD